MPDPAIYYSNGKLMLTAEYVVLDGALSLAFPVRLGQQLTIRPNETDHILRWHSHALGLPWFNAEYETGTLRIMDSSDENIARRLQQLLINARTLNPKILDGNHGFHAQTDLGFDIGWGLGSSSTLVSNVAFWFETDPYELFRMTYEGSGYDIACARSKTPLFYRMIHGFPEVTPVTFNPPFRDSLYFVHLGKKQDSSAEVRSFLRKPRPSSAVIEQISRITHAAAVSEDLRDFEKLMNEHEDILSMLLDMKRIGEHYFKDFRGTIKSLGAWGGDFILVTWPDERNELQQYFAGKGLNTVFSFDELILK